MFRRINNLRRINPPEGFDSNPCKQGVAGSIPATSTTSRVQSVRNSSKFGVSPLRVLLCSMSCRTALAFTENGLNQVFLKFFAQELLLLRIELLALRSNVENIDGLLALRVHQRDFDVASQTRQLRSDLVEHSRSCRRTAFEHRRILVSHTRSTTAPLHS